MLLNIIKKSASLVIQNPTITLFLVLFLILSNLLGSLIVTTSYKAIAVILILCLFVFVAVFLSGWFQVIKESNSLEEIKNKNYYSIFFDGCGKNVISVLLGIIIYLVLMTLVFFLTREFCQHVFGSLDFIFKNPSYATAQDSTSIMEFLNNLSDDEKYTIYAWQFAFLGAISLFNFLFLFYFPSIINKKENVFIKPFSAIVDSIKFVFKNFIGAVILYTFIQLLHVLPAILNIFVPQNSFFGVLILLLYIYFASYMVMLIFSYYEAKNNSTDRAYCIGENQTCDSIGTQD